MHGIIGCGVIRGSGAVHAEALGPRGYGPLARKPAWIYSEPAAEMNEIPAKIVHL